MLVRRELSHVAIRILPMFVFLRGFNHFFNSWEIIISDILSIIGPMKLFLGVTGGILSAFSLRSWISQYVDCIPWVIRENLSHLRKRAYVVNCEAVSLTIYRLFFIITHGWPNPFAVSRGISTWVFRIQNHKKNPQVLSIIDLYRERLDTAFSR